MASSETIKTTIDVNINTNGNQAITGAVMNSVLKQMVDSTDAQLAELSEKVSGISEVISVSTSSNIVDGFSPANFADYNPDNCVVEGSASEFTITPPSPSNFVIGLNIGKLEVGHTYEFSLHLNASLKETHLTHGKADGSSGTGVAVMTRTSEADGSIVDSCSVKIADADDHYFRIYGKWGSNLTISNIIVKDLDSKEVVSINFPNDSIKGDSIISLDAKKIEGGMRMDLITEETLSYWISYADGSYIPTGTYFSTYKASVEGMTDISAHVYLTDTAAAAIALYDKNGKYLKEASVQGEGTGATGKTFKATIPPMASYAVITSNNNLGGKPSIYTYGGTSNVLIRLANLEQLQDNDVPLYGDMVLHRLGDVYHLGMSATASRDYVNSVPSQSIYDVRCAKALGYNVIEANLHITADGKYVTTHGQGGALGHDFDDLQGNDAYGVVINTKTLAELQTNYRYHTDVEEYRIPITTLEEFCAEAKKCGLVVMLQYRDKASLEIARGIMGDNMLYMYNAPRGEYSGAITEYLSRETKEEIIARCEEVGRPYIYCMANPYFFSEEQLCDICREVHLKGYYISSAYVPSDYASTLKGCGFDYIATDGIAPYLKSNQAVVSDKVLTFNSDGSVSWKDLDLQNNYGITNHQKDTHR